MKLSSRLQRFGGFQAHRGGLVLFLILLVSLVTSFSPVKVDANRDGAGTYLKKYQRPASIPFPKDNGYSRERETLGRVLFFDPRLSGSNWISCGTCHNPALGWGDGLPKGIGHGMKELGRRTPTILNLAWSETFFWDGRAATLEEQALGPIASPGEMNLPTNKMIDKIILIPEYKVLFHKAYPGEPINERLVAKAIATFERKVVSGKAPFDRWLEGDKKAVSEEAKRGFVLFNGKANCAQCHSGWRLSDDSFHDIGIPGEDRGRGALFKEVPGAQFTFKTPTLRNVDRRAPYMHDGSVSTLEEVVEFYNIAGKAKRPSLSPEIKPLNLTEQEKRELIAFLRTLTSTDKPIEIPMLPR
jgi:cytochrome c peroxidase